MSDAREQLLALYQRYEELFGEDALGEFCDFTQDPAEARSLLSRAIERGAAATEEEIAWLNRNVVEGAAY